MQILCLYLCANQTVLMLKMMETRLLEATRKEMGAKVELILTQMASMQVKGILSSILCTHASSRARTHTRMCTNTQSYIRTHADERLRLQRACAYAHLNVYASQRTYTYVATYVAHAHNRAAHSPPVGARPVTQGDIGPAVQVRESEDSCSKTRGRQEGGRRQGSDSMDKVVTAITAAGARSPRPSTR